jgi:predicted phage terminase large subunit-like protein
VSLRLKDRDALKKWDAYRKSVLQSTQIDIDESETDKKSRIASLKVDFVAFCKYYFPKYCKAEFADFQKKAAREIENNQVLVAVLAWARDHAKSVIVDLFLPAYLCCAGKSRNVLLVSKTGDAATELLMPLMIQLESNMRLINDYGTFKSMNNWAAGNFKTNCGWSFRGLGAGQSPRGARNEEARPDMIIVDDIDDDETCRNPKRMDDLWDWVMGALYPCFDIGSAKRFIVIGNIIAKNSIVDRALKIADFKQVVNILNEKGQPSWKENYTLEQCQYMIGKLGYRLSQREYFNNPFSEGKVFKKAWMQFGAIPPIHSMKLQLAYLDPGFKKTKTSDTKALVLVSLHKGKYYIIKVYCGQASIEEMIQWCYDMEQYVIERKGSFRLKMEEVFLQSLLYKDFAEAGLKRNHPLPLSGDTRKKPDKDARIEATSGHYERGNVILNEEEEGNHHMGELIEQYLNFQPGVNTKKDGPDAVEGAFFILQNSLAASSDISLGERHLNKHRA